MKKMEALKQGNLDGLCGIYSIINSINYLFGKKFDENLKNILFKTLIEKLDEKPNQLKNTITNGTYVKHINDLLNITKKYLDKNKIYIEIDKGVNTKIFSKQNINVKGFFNSIEQYITNNNAVIIMGIEGKYSHWTCVIKTTPKTIKFLDSDGIKPINKNNCTLEKSIKENKCHLNQKWVWGIRKINKI